jgi:prepilin-type N-terminal cleavage/methylation domain-containing protein
MKPRRNLIQIWHMKNSISRSSGAFTLIELFVVIAIIAVLAAELVPVLAKTGKDVRRAQCVTNIKQVGLAFRVWGDEHGDKYPMAVSTAQGGAMENITGQTSSHAAGYGVTNVFCVMSNELRTPTILHCPADFSMNNAVGAVATMATNWGSFGPGNLSYFVDGDASDAYPKMILIGDRNIGSVINGQTGNAALPNWGILPADSMNMQNAGYCEAAAPLGVTLKQLPWAWTDGDLHQDSGNLGMANGSVNQASLKGLMNANNDTINAKPGYRKLVFNMP